MGLFSKDIKKMDDLFLHTLQQPSRQGGGALLQVGE